MGRARLAPLGGSGALPALPFIPLVFLRATKDRTK